MCEGRFDRVIFAAANPWCEAVACVRRRVLFYKLKLFPDLQNNSSICFQDTIPPSYRFPQVTLMVKLHQCSDLQSALGAVCAGLGQQVTEVLRLLSVSVMAALVFSFFTAPAFPQALPDDTSPFPDILRDGVLQPQARLWFLDNGEPVLIPDSALEDRLRSDRSGSDAGIPNWSFGAIEVDVDATSDSGEVASVTASATITADGVAGVANVGLRLGTLRLTGQPVFNGTADRNIFQTTDDGYSWTLVGSAETKHSITLNGKSVISRDVGRRKMLLSLPMSTCKIHARLPKSAAEPRTRDPSDIIRTKLTDDALEVTINSSGGDVELSWLVDRPSKRVAAIVADTETTFSIRDPQQVWAATTNLQLSWYGTEAANKISVALPPGARLRTSLSYDYDSFRIDVSLHGDPDNAYQLLEIENTSIEQSPTLTLPFEWEWQPLLEDSSESQEFSSSVRIAPLQITGVDLHRGKIESLFQSQYSVTLDLSDGMSLSLQSRTDAGKMLEFDFDSQDTSLRLTLRREQSLPIIRPTYHVKVDGNKLTLTGWLECSFDANQLSRTLGLEMPSWVLQENNARVVVESASAEETGEVLEVRQNPNSAGSYTLIGPDLATPDFSGATRSVQTWRFVAQRDIDPGDGLEIQVPEIVRGRTGGQQITESGSGVLILTSADNILLRASPGIALLEDSYSEQYQKYVSPGGMRIPLVYRFQPSENAPYWSGNADQLPRQIAYSEEAAVSVLRSQIDIKQRFELQIANAPLDELRFAIPRIDSEGAANNGVTPLVYVDDLLVGASFIDSVTAAELQAEYGVALAEASADSGSAIDNSASKESDSAAKPATEEINAAEDQWLVFQLVASPELLGNRQIRIEASVSYAAKVSDATNEDAAESAQTVGVPLAKLLLPAEARRARSEWSLSSSGSVSATPIRRFDVLDAADSATNAALVRRILPADFATIDLLVSEVEREQTLRIGNVWLQTAITRVHRRDRFVATVVAGPGELRLTLPKFIDDIRVFVDGVSREDYQYDYSSDSMLVELTGESVEEHVIEVSYFQQENLSWLRRVSLKSPRIEGSAAVEEFCWELLTPQTQHVAWCPGALTSNWSWNWGGFWWKRESPELSFRGALTASTQSRLPISMNRYLMSSSRMPSGVDIWVLSRFALWFPVGLSSILIAYCVLNFAVFRRPLSMVAYAIVLAFVALLWPDFSMLLGQTSIFALSLVGMVWVTQVAVDSRVRRRSVFSSRSVNTQDSARKYASSRSVPPAPVPEIPSTRSTGSSVAASEGR